MFVYWSKTILLSEMEHWQVNASLLLEDVFH